MNLADRAVLYFAPERAAKRAAARVQIGVLTELADQTSTQRSETRWRGASRILRSLSSWIPGLGSATTDLPQQERETLTARSYDAYRNHTIARAAITRNRTNIVGTGLIMHPAVDAKTLGLTEDQAEELNAQIAREWSTFADDPAECDAEATLDLYGLQALALVSALLGGDCFALTPFRERPGKLWGTKVQMVDGARVSNPTGRVSGPSADGGQLIDGVELDAYGEPRLYWIRRAHPADRHGQADGWDGIPVFGGQTGRRRALHIWNEKDRIGAVRGAPYLAPILEPLQTLETYSRAELAAAVVSSLFTVFIKKEQELFDANGAAVGAFAQQGATSSSAEAAVLQMGNAAIVDLAPGEEAQFADPTRPNANFDPFFTSVCTQMAAALELPVDELMLRYQASYSAARAAMLQAWRFYLVRRWGLVQQLCAPIYRLWFDEAVARGRIQVSGYADPVRRAAYTSALWVGPARGSMDEEKEARAAETRIRIGVSNETIETAQMTGEDWRVVFAARQRELRMRAEGLPEAGASSQAAPGTQPEDDQQ